jgi:hypothetical protein
MARGRRVRDTARQATLRIQRRESHVGQSRTEGAQIRSVMVLFDIGSRYIGLIDHSRVRQSMDLLTVALPRPGKRCATVFHRLEKSMAARECEYSAIKFLIGGLGLLLALGARQATAQSQSGLVVSDARYTAPYDAFMKMNRLQESFAREQTAADYWGFLESRLGNQAGRILIKRPASGFDDDAFRGWLMFIRAYGDATGVGNCTACHTVPDFTDMRRHNIGTAQDPIETPSLRDLDSKRAFFKDASAPTLEEAIARHVENGRLALANKQAGVDESLGQIRLNEEEIKRVAAFLRSLRTLERDQFREHLIDVVIQPVELDFSN